MLNARFTFAVPLAIFVTIVIFLGLSNVTASAPAPEYSNNSEPVSIVPYERIPYQLQPIHDVHGSYKWCKNSDETSTVNTTQSPLHTGKKKSPPPQPDIAAKCTNIISLSPIVRIQPNFPERCASKASPITRVFVQYNIDTSGEACEIRLYTRNACFNRATLRSVEKWKFARPCSIIKNQKTTITFQQ